MPKGKLSSETRSAQSYDIETRSKTESEYCNVSKFPTSEMSSTETIRETQAGKIPAESGQVNPVPVNQTQIQQDRSRKTHAQKRKKQTATVGLGTSSVMTATTGNAPTQRASDVNVPTSGPSNPIETTAIVG